MRLYKEAPNGTTIKSGLTTTGKSRPLMIDALYSMVTDDPSIIKSRRMAMELIGLVQKNNGKVEADSGCNDDIAMTLAFGSYVRKYNPPLMLDVDSPAIDQFADIMNMNDDIYVDGKSRIGIDDKTIHKSIHDFMNENHEGGTINTFDFFN